MQNPYYHVARVAHEANRAYCLSLGDTSQPPWDLAPDWQKKSAMNGVQYHVENPLATPEDSHENWLEQKAKEGWTFGETKDPVAKTHPCFRPYGDLPMEQRVKDYVFRAVVHAFVDAGYFNT